MSIPILFREKTGKVFLVDRAEQFVMDGQEIYPSAVYLGAPDLQQGSIWIEWKETKEGNKMTVPAPCAYTRPGQGTREFDVRKVGITLQQAEAMLVIVARLNKVTIEGVFDKAAGRRKYVAKLKADKRRSFSTLDLLACCHWDKFNQKDFTWAQRAEYLGRLGHPITEGNLKMRAAEIGLTLGG